jgi:hypothetical protein
MLQGASRHAGAQSSSPCGFALSAADQGTSRATLYTISAGTSLLLAQPTCCHSSVRHVPAVLTGLTCMPAQPQCACLPQLCCLCRNRWQRFDTAEVGLVPRGHMPAAPHSTHLLPAVVPVSEAGNTNLQVSVRLRWHGSCCPSMISSAACFCVCPDKHRWQRFNAAEVAWFLVGTSYDMATHAAIAGLLAHQLLATPAAVY